MKCRKMVTSYFIDATKLALLNATFLCVFITLISFVFFSFILLLPSYNFSFCFVFSFPLPSCSSLALIPFSPPFLFLHLFNRNTQERDLSPGG